MPIRIMHFADTHFGVESYGKLDPATGLNTRLVDFRESLCRAIDSALERGIDLAIFAGDAYKSRDPNQTQQREFAQCVRQITERGIPLVMLTGNHDIPNVRGRAHALDIYRTLGVTNVHIFHQPEVRTIDTAGGPVQIAAMPYLMRGFMLARDEFVGKSAEQVREMMELRYEEYVNDLRKKIDPTIPSVLMGHFWVSGARVSDWQRTYFNPNEPQLAVSLLNQPGVFDYVALGHIHRYQDLNGGNQPPVVYCGSPDRIDFGERTENKGFVYVQLDKGHADHEFVEVPGSRRLVEINVEAGTDSPTESILDAIRRESPLDGHIVRLTYHVDSEHVPLIRDKEIREALSSAFMVVAIRADIRRDQTQRTALLNESLDPLTALGHYYDQDDKKRKRFEQLRPYAERLLEDLRQEEALQ